MAVEKIINLKVNDDIKDTENNVVSLKSQLKQAQAEVQNLSDKFGATSREAVEAAKKAAELKDRIGDAKSLTDAYNPDAKFKALTGALSGAAGAGAAFAGTMGLVGVESKDVEQALLKVQSAMAISQGLQAVGESIDQFKILKTVIFGSTAAKTADTVATEANNASQSKNILGRGIQIVQTGVQTVLTGALTAATYLFNAAMAANPIGAIVAVIALLIASGYALINMFKESSAAAKKSELANKALANEIKNNKKEQDKANETFQEARDHQLGMAKASGKSAEEIRKLTLQLAKQELQQNLTNYETNRATALEAKRRAGLEGATDEAKKNAAEAIKLNNESVKAVNQSQKDIRKIESQNAIERKQEQTDAYKESLQNQKKAGEDAANTIKENNKKAAEERAKQQQEEKDALTKKYRDAEAKADDFYAAEQKAKEGNLKATMSAQAVELQTLRDSYAEKLKYAQENGFSSLQLQQELLRKENEIKLKFQNEAIAKEDAQWLRMQELTLTKSEYDKIVLAQKYEAEYTAASGNVELQTELKNNLEKNIKIIDDKAVQIDINVGNLDWLNFSYYSNTYKDNVKGLHRTQLMVAMFKVLDKIFSHGTGVKDKKTKEIVATNPQEALAVLNKGYGLNLSQDILNDYFELMDSLKKNLSEEKLNQILDAYLKILDSTKTDIPLDLQKYWINNQSRLGLKGKLLPDDSNLTKYKTT